jgi:hypothetical protein
MATVLIAGSLVVLALLGLVALLVSGRDNPSSTDDD